MGLHYFQPHFLFQHFIKFGFRYLDILYNIWVTKQPESYLAHLCLLEMYARRVNKKLMEQLRSAAQRRSSIPLEQAVAEMLNRMECTFSELFGKYRYLKPWPLHACIPTKSELLERLNEMSSFRVNLSPEVCVVPPPLSCPCATAVNYPLASEG